MAGNWTDSNRNCLSASLGPRDGPQCCSELTTAVRWKPCNCNFLRLPFSSSVWALTRSFMSWVHIMSLRPLKPGQPPCDFKNTLLSVKKWALYSSFQRSLFFADTHFYPTAAFCGCWPSALRESSVWSQHSSWRRPHIDKQAWEQEDSLHTLLTADDWKYIFDHIHIQMGKLMLK